jgi:hypothetical protein
MGGARALIASVGASVSLVASAALSLLVFSLVVAYDGFTGAVDSPVASTALLRESQPATGAPGRRTKAREAATQVLVRPTPRGRTVARAASRPAAAGRHGTVAAPPSFNPSIRDLSPAEPAPAQAAPAPAPAPEPATGDAIRDVGDVVTATVKGTGQAAGAAAPLLGPPVSQAVQDVLDLLTSVLQGATGALGSVLDGTPPA